jgi:hypothetical protein
MLPPWLLRYDATDMMSVRTGINLPRTPFSKRRRARKTVHSSGMLIRSLLCARDHTPDTLYHRRCPPHPVFDASIVSTGVGAGGGDTMPKRRR